MLRRLLSMGIGEVADRSRQEASKWLDRQAVWGERALPEAWTARVRRANGNRTSEAQAAFSGFRASGPERFFDGAVHPGTPASLEKVAPAAREQARASAENIRRGRFDLLGYTGLSFGDPIDWQFDPVSGRRAPFIHWSLIDPTDAPSFGDCKVVWELSRQQYLVTLGIAYRTTGDEGCADAFSELIQSWMRANPKGLGTNWASSLEAAFRIVSWSWALFLFKDSKDLTPALFTEILSSLDVHASHVERYLSRHSSPNTHLTGEALGLFYAGTLFPENGSSARWRALGQSLLDEQIQVQVHRDGVYFEQSTAYQVYTVEIYLHYLMLARRNGALVPPAVSEAVQRMLDVLLALRRPGGGMPAIGDADGGSLLPLHRRTPDDTRGVFSTAAVFFGRSDYAWAAEALQPETLWLLGPEAAATFQNLSAAPPLGNETSRSFALGGYIVMRSGWARDAHHLIFDVGPLGCPRSGGHGHADLLSVQVSPFGEPYIVDPGTYLYSADPAFRNHFRSTQAHSSIVVDGQSQAEPRGPFGWRERPSARLTNFVSTEAFDLADATQDAYRRLPDPVVHRRRVIFVKSPGYWVIIDDLAGRREHTIELRFQFAPMPLKAVGDGWVSASDSSGRGLLLRSYAQRPLLHRIEEGATSPVEGWVSHHFGRRTPAPVLIGTSTGLLPFRIVTLLLPVAHAAATPPNVRPLVDLEGTPMGLVFEEQNKTVRLLGDTFTIESSQS